MTQTIQKNPSSIDARASPILKRVKLSLETLAKKKKNTLYKKGSQIIKRETHRALERRSYIKMDQTSFQLKKLITELTNVFFFFSS
jgi:hypothetical protein